MNLVDQNLDGNKFAVSYQDNGVFNVLLFDHNGDDIMDLDVSALLGIDNESKPVKGFYEPLITLFFNPDTTNIFIQVYHRI